MNSGPVSGPQYRQALRRNGRHQPSQRGSRRSTRVSVVIWKYVPRNTRPVPNVAVMLPETLSVLSQVNATGLREPLTFPEPVPAVWHAARDSASVHASVPRIEIFMP